MQSKATTVEAYINELPADRKEPVKKLRSVIKTNIPKGFQECISYGMIGYVVPHSIYPAGYHCNPKDPLPYLNLASQKNYIAVYHMGVYANSKLLKWFTDEYAKAGVGKLDMGKACIRFKKPENIPYKLIGELASKITLEEWIGMCEKSMSRKK